VQFFGPKARKPDSETVIIYAFDVEHHIRLTWAEYVNDGPLIAHLRGPGNTLRPAVWPVRGQEFDDLDDIQFTEHVTPQLFERFSGSIPEHKWCTMYRCNTPIRFYHKAEYNRDRAFAEHAYDEVFNLDDPNCDRSPLRGRTEVTSYPTPIKRQLVSKYLLDLTQALF
jgi:hypothetical protein